MQDVGVCLIVAEAITLSLYPTQLDGPQLTDDSERGASGDLKNRRTDCRVAQLVRLVWNNDALQRYHNTIHLHFQWNFCFF